MSIQVFFWPFAWELNNIFFSEIKRDMYCVNIDDADGLGWLFTFDTFELYFLC